MLPEGGCLDDKNIVFLVDQKVQRRASNWSVFKDLKKNKKKLIREGGYYPREGSLF